MSALEQILYSEAEKVARSCGLELYDATYQPANKKLIIFIQDPKTKTAVIEDCVKVDKAFDLVCEQLEQHLPDDFVLEVSSPGVYRHLKTAAHYQQAIDQIISLKLSSDIMNLGKKIRATLKNITFLSDDNFELEIEVKGKRIKIESTNIKSAHCDPDF
jgi:ribosome maturation factor RimP